MVLEPVLSSTSLWSDVLNSRLYLAICDELAKYKKSAVSSSSFSIYLTYPPFNATSSKFIYWLYPDVPFSVVIEPSAKASNSSSSIFVVMFLIASPFVELEFSTISSFLLDVPTNQASPSTLVEVTVVPAPVVAANCKLIAISLTPITSSAAALSPTTSIPLNLPSWINGAGYSLKSAAIAPIKVAPNIVAPVPRAIIFFIVFLNFIS